MTTQPSARRRDSASRFISGSVEKVFDAFTDATSLMRWLPPAGMTGTAVEYDFRKGGNYRIELKYASATSAAKSTERTDVTKGSFLDLDPGRLIRQSVVFESDNPAFGGEMTMTWVFEPIQTGTRVTVVAENVPPGISESDHQAGLRSSLENLAKFVESA